ncbi:MAG: menaquinone biosynthesis protein [Chitinophagaceae bacterium]|nr:menaquinone biosynthesis protein [Chitinophagaceae bacterium]
MDRSGKIKAGAVSYLNTKPLIYGFEEGMMNDRIDLVKEYPSRIAAMLLDDEIDIGLVPVAIIPALNEAHIITRTCIGCDGPVASVCLFSEVPIHHVEKVLLDYQSRTSARLIKILIEKYWKINPELVDTEEDFREQIKGSTAGLVIGDRAFTQRTISPYIYDLGEAWKEFTGLPFVFATWVANKALPADFIHDFNNATAYGLQHLDQVIANNPFDKYSLHTYYKQNISFELTNEKRKGMELFLQML